MMVESTASAKFDSCMEGVLARLAESRVQIALQIVASSINPSKLDQLQAELDKIPDNSPKKNAVDVARIVEQLASVMPQIVALDLDRTTPMRILGFGRTTIPVMFSAKCFGHDVALVGGRDLATTLLLGLYDMSYAGTKAAGKLPDGPFDLIISHGGPNLSTKQAWAAFALMLAGKLTESGRIFVVLAKQSRKNYHPEVVLTKLARMGARVSSKNGFVLLDRAVIKKFAPGTTKLENASEPTIPEKDSAKPEVELLDLPSSAEPQTAAADIKPNWKRSVALIGSSVVLIGLLVANWTWSGH